MEDGLEKLGRYGVIPVVTIENAEDSLQLGKALIVGGLPCVEVTFRTKAAEEAIHIIASGLPKIVLGAGTVLSVEQAERAVNAGAKFIVSPGLDPLIVEWCVDQGVPVIPGVATPSEISIAYSMGLRILKFFPAEAFGGVRTLRAIAAPFRNIKFIPTGGINQNNLANYVSMPMVHACGGSWLVRKQLIEDGQFTKITRMAQMAVAIVKQVRL